MIKKGPILWCAEIAIMFSPEDVAWADSCLSKDPEISDNDWNLNSLSDALLETYTPENKLSVSDKDRHTQVPVDIDNLPKLDRVDGRNSVKTAINSTSVTSNGSETKSDDHLDHENNADDPWLSHEIEDTFLPTYGEDSIDPELLDEDTGFSLQNIDLDVLRNSVKAAINSATVTSNRTETKSGDHLGRENNTDDFWSSHKIEDIFLPTYNENSRDLGLLDEETDFGFEASDSGEEIFKVWDLNLQIEEEDEMVKQLNNKGFGENSLEQIFSVSDDNNDAKAWRDLPDQSIDDLISGIADLTLSSNSGLIC